MVLEVAAAAVFRMDDGLEGALACFLGIKEDTSPGLGVGETLAGVTRGLGAADNAAAASRDRRVETVRVGRELVAVLSRVAGACDARIGALTCSSSGSSKPMLSSCFMIISSIILSHLAESS